MVRVEWQERAAPARRRAVCALAACVVSAIAWGARAATVDDLQTAVVPVADNSEAEFARGLAAAFQLVIVRLTGNSQSANTPSIAKLRARARQYNTLFGYERGADATLQLRADFDVVTVSAALRERGFNVWGRERPDLAAWLVVRDAQGVRAVPDDATREIFESFERHARVRAIPLRRLVPDDAARAVLSARAPDDDLFSGLGALATQSGAPARLVFVLSQADDSTAWRARWQLEVEEELQTGDGQAELPVPVVTANLDRALDALAQHYLQGTAPGTAGTVGVIVTDVGSAEAYGRVLDYLSRLDGVRAVRLTRVEGTALHLEVDTLGGLPALTQVIGFGRVLAAASDQPGRFRFTGP